TSWGHVQLDNCNFEGAQLHIRGPGTCQARFCSFSQGSSTHLLGVVLSLLDSCDFSGSDTASVTVEGPPASERNWACKHLAALARTFPAQSNSTPKGPEGSSTGEPDPSSGNVKKENMNMEDWKRRTGGNAACRGTVIEDGWSDGEHTEGEEENQEAIDNSKKFFTLDYKIPYNHHGLSHLLKTRADGSLPPASSPVPPSVTPEPLTLQQELDRDPEAQMLASSILGCILRRCLFRDGKGGVHLSNCGQARLEENVFRGLNYAIVMLRNEVCECRASGVFLRLSAQGLIAENNIHSNGEAGLDIRKGANPIILVNLIPLPGSRSSYKRERQRADNRSVWVALHIFFIHISKTGLFMQVCFVYIPENVIRENQWGGVDIRRGGDPILRNNYICYGYSDGVVVGERGRGLIEGNHVYCMSFQPDNAIIFYQFAFKHFPPLFSPGNKGCGVWVMSSSLPQLLGNYIVHNCMYGLAVFCRKDPDNIEAREGSWAGQEGIGGDIANGERRGVEGEAREGQENFNEEGELFAWESDLDSEDERHSARRSISVALMEGNCVSYNGGTKLCVT
ncbi:hypothetical protein XENOCAPTIV_004887, partial [Xenoophorus captivus]